jgi:hypothetical protein
MFSPLSSENKMTEHGMTLHHIAKQKEALKIPLAHKTMTNVFWGAKECILVSFLPQAEAEMLLVNFSLSRKFILLTLTFREAERSSCNMKRCNPMLLIGAWRGFSKMTGNFCPIHPTTQT